MAAICIREAEPWDAGEICRVHRASITALCSGHYTAEQISAWAGGRQPDHYEKAMEACAVYVAAGETGVVGFGMMDVGEGLVIAVYVHPDHVGAGLGSRLLSALEAEAETAGAAKLWLHATLNAVSFYERHGFASLGPATNTLPSGVELPCVRMEKRLHEPPAGRPAPSGPGGGRR